MAELTQMQAAFAAEYAANGGNAAAAARKAGYSAHTATVQGGQLLAIPKVRDEINRHLLRLRARSGAVGLETLVGIAQDGKAPAAARVAAARTLLEHAGLVGTAKATDDERRAADDEPEDRISPSEFLARLAAANRAPA